MSGDGQFKPPGKLRLLLRALGGYLYGILISLGWQPKEGRDDGKKHDTR
jgi:hypothetical protein